MKRAKQQPSGGIHARQADDAVDRCRDCLPERQHAGQQQKRWEQHRKEAEQVCGADNGRQSSSNHGVQHGLGGFVETRGEQQKGRWLLWLRPPFGDCGREAASGFRWSSQCESTRRRPTRSHNGDASKRGRPRLICGRISQSPNYCREQPTRVFMRVTDLAAFRPRTDGRGSGWFRSTWLRLTEEAPRLTFFEHGGVQGWTVTTQGRGGTPSRTVI
jgi:hypothetical protein